VTVTVQELAWASRVVRDAVKDRSYRATPLGLKVARYCRWKKNEWGATIETMRDYERTLAWLALDHADLDLVDFEPPVGTERVREFLEHRWGDRTARTRAKNLSIIRDFFRWSVREGHMHGDPTVPILRPRQRKPRTTTFAIGVGDLVIAAQPRARDRVALALMFHVAVRKGELRGVQFKHFDHGRHQLWVFGKGQKWRAVPLIHQATVLELERYILDHAPAPDDYLLYPEKRGPHGTHGPIDVLWHDTKRKLSSSATHRWWAACLERAGVPHQRMHEARHTAITAVVRATGNLKAAQLLAGHESIQTTADIYSHLDTSDVANALRKTYEANE
jgi:site-specific recombinase XerC